MDDGARFYRRYLDGDESGFDELIGLYHDNLIFFINRHVKNFAAAEDLAADCFMELIVHKKRYSFKSSFKTYLFSIARHKAIDYIRRERRFTSLPEEEMPEDVSDADTVERAVITGDEKRAVQAAIAGLSQDYATYLHLAVFEELENDEIARVMKKSKKQLANIAYRAKNALRAALVGSERKEESV